ncbi:hypothetical protein J2X14_003641 [Pantoea alhagi]|uniref:hypothetical protein n=1 Tax=Mixta sp. BE291 TaxID=3158787 RepID=UPI002854EA2D|nr:hypothetical protein [Pantoea alhagi]
MCKVSQAGLSTSRFFNQEGVKGKAVENNITEKSKKSSFSRLGNLLKRVINISIFLKGRRSNKENSAAQVISVNRISFNEDSILRNLLTKASIKPFNGNEKVSAFTPCAENFFHSSKQAPAKLPPPPPLSNNNSSMTTDRMQSGNTTSITEPFVSTPAQPASRSASSSIQAASPLAQSAQLAPLSSSSVSSSKQPAPSSVQLVPPPAPPLASSSAQLAPPPPPLPAQDFLIYNNELTKRPSNGAGKNSRVMQKKTGSNEQVTTPGAFFNNLDVNKLTPFQKKIYQQMQENAAIKAKSDQELAEKKAADKAKEAQQEARKKIDELKNRQAFIEKCKDGVPPPPPPPPSAEKRPVSDKRQTGTVGNKKATSISPKKSNLSKPEKSEAFVNELKERLSRRAQQQERLKTNNDTQ